MYKRKTVFSRSRDQCAANWCTNFNCSLGLGFGDGFWGWVFFRVMVEFGTSSAFRGWVRVWVLGHGVGVRGRKVKSRDCALASDLVRARVVAVDQIHYISSQQALQHFSQAVQVFCIPQFDWR